MSNSGFIKVFLLGSQRVTLSEYATHLGYGFQIPMPLTATFNKFEKFAL